MPARTDDDVIFRPSLYIGSFAVEDGNQAARVKKVQMELEARRTFKKSKPLVVCVSTRGIKICSTDIKIVYMAHALRRISYATCDSAFKQVVFLAREPRGQANLQYCHVFVTETSEQAEELNRIIGDAFQLAYARQYLSQVQQQQHQQNSNSSGSDGIVDSTDQPVMFRLTDRYPQWSGSSTTSTGLLDQSCYRLELPPPPDCPPPPPLPETGELQGGTQQRQQCLPINGDYSQETATATATATDLSEGKSHDVCVSVPTSDKAKAEDLAERLRRISTPQIGDVPFRRNFLRRSEGKGPTAVAVSSTSGDPGGAGGTGLGSILQPIRRRHGLSDLFRSSARHSAFFPSSLVRDILPPTSEAHLSDSSEPIDSKRLDCHQPGSSSSSALASQKSPPFVLDLRTFDGGSPVVALKERLDARAAAEARALAIAETAAVLAAAKLAASGAVATVTTTAAATGPSTTSLWSSAGNTGSLSSSSGSTDGRAANGSAVSTRRLDEDEQQQHHHHHQQQQPQHKQLQSCRADCAAPIPPTRMYSLQRHRHPHTLSNAISNCETTGRCQMTNLHAAPVEEQFYDKAAADDGPENGAVDGANAPIATRCSSSSGDRNPGVHRLSLVDSQLHAFNPVRNSVRGFPNHHREKVKPIQTPPTTEGHTRQAPPSTTTSYNTNQLTACPEATTAAGGLNDYLHVTTASGSQKRHHQQVTTAVAATADAASACDTGAGAVVVSGETPTPTPTATPTPTQMSSQPFGATAIGELDMLHRAVLPREIAFDLLAREEVGSYLIRNSVTYPDCCALSVRVPKRDNPTGITHYLIQCTQHGVRLKGLDKEWPTLSALITHLTVIPEMLPCRLRQPIHSINPTFTHMDDQQQQRQQQSQVAAPASRYPSQEVGGSTALAWASRGGQPLNRPTGRPSDDNNRPGSGHCDHRMKRSHRRPQRDVGANREEAVGSWRPWQTTGNGGGQYAEADPEEDDLGGAKDEDDEDYQRLSDFSSLLADLKVPSSSLASTRQQSEEVQTGF